MAKPVSPPPPDDPRFPDDPSRGATPEQREHPPPKLPPVDPKRLEEVKSAVDAWIQTKGGIRQEGVWPYLLIRGVVGDQGVRPFGQTVAFWESPDIKVVEGTVPTLTGQTPTLHPTAGMDHTVFVHVWNLGRLASYGTRVSVYWANPAFNFVGPTLIGSALVDLPDRTHADCHGIVRIPQLWNPVFVNNGHECLLAKVDALLDGGGIGFDVRTNRHTAQRNLMLAAPHADLTQLFDRLSTAVPAGSELHLLHAMGAVMDVAATHLPHAGIRLVPPVNPPRQAAVLPNGVVHLGAIAGVHSAQSRYIPPEVFARRHTPIITPQLLKDHGVIAMPAQRVGVTSDRIGVTSAAATLLNGIGIRQFDAGGVARALGDGPNVGHLLRFEARHGGNLIGGYSVIVTQSPLMRASPSQQPRAKD